MNPTILLLLTLVLGIFFDKTKGKIIQHIPSSGVGNLLLSHDDEHEEYNKLRLMVEFDLECLGFDESIQKGKIQSMIEEKHFPCLSDHNVHIQHSKRKKGYSFLNLKSMNNGSCIHDVNRILNYTDHCINFVMYEPLFRLNFHHLSSSEYSCITQNVAAQYMPITSSAAWDLDQLDSAKQNNEYTHPSFAFDNGVDLYVVDSGVLASHDEFYTGQVIHKQGDGPTFYEYNSSVTWYASHGTHVSGSFGGKNYGVTKNLTIYDYRVCEFSPYSDYWTPSSAYDYPCPYNLIASGLEGVVNQLSSTGRRGVINLSLGGSRSDISVMYDYYFDLIVQNGGIAVVAAGNDNILACNDAPAYSDYCIAVGAMNSTLKKAWFSNYGECVDIWGPGVDIWSSVADCDDCYAMYDGTSMASPHIAGVVASYLWVNPNLTYSDIRSILQYNTTRITGGKCDVDTCKFPFINHCSATPTYTHYDWTAIDKSNSAYKFDTYSSVSGTDGDFVAIIDVNVSTLKINEVAYYATDKCTTVLDDPSDYFSYAYICDSVLNNTAYLYYYRDQTCTGNNKTLFKTITSGDVIGYQSYYVKCKSRTNDLTSNNGLGNSIGVRAKFIKSYYEFGTTYVCDFGGGYVEQYEDTFYVADACYWSHNGTDYYSYKYSCTDNTIYQTYYYSSSDCSGYYETEYQTNGCYPQYGYYFEVIECPGYNLSSLTAPTPTHQSGGFTIYYINYILVWMSILVAIFTI